MNRATILTLLILLLVLVGVFYFYLNVRENNILEEIKPTAAESVFLSEVTYTDIDGNELPVVEYADSTVVAVAWASWCPSCVEQLKIVSQVAEEHDIVVLAFNRAEPIKTAKDFLAFHKLETKVQLVMDDTDNFYTSIGGRAMPETVIFNSKGEIVHHERELFTKEELEKVLEKIQNNN